MDYIVSIDKLTFRYNDNFIFDKFSLNIGYGSFLTITGKNGCGKSTLIKIITGLILTDSDIKICDVKLNKNNLYSIRKNIGVMFDNVDNSFITDTVEDELAFILENLCYKSPYIKRRIKEVSAMLNIEHLLNKSLDELSGGEKCIVALGCAIIHNPKLLIIDESLSMIDVISKEKIFKYLSNLNKNGMTIINVTHDLSESYYSNRLIVINNGKILLDGTPTRVMEYDKVLNKLGISIPFEIELSIKLKLYGLVDKLYTNMNEMVDDIWQ